MMQDDDMPTQGAGAGDSSGDAAGETGGKAGKPEKAVTRGRRGPRAGPEVGLERIAEVHYCNSDEEANQYLALGPEWDLQDILPMRVETQEGGERDEVHFVVARWETDKDRAKLRQRDRRWTGGRKGS
jgi:hypothetical protein